MLKMIELREFSSITQVMGMKRPEDGSHIRVRVLARVELELQCQKSLTLLKNPNWVHKLKLQQMDAILENSAMMLKNGGRKIS